MRLGSSTPVRNSLLDRTYLATGLHTSQARRFDDALCHTPDSFGNGVIWRQDSGFILTQCLELGLVTELYTVRMV